MADEENPKDKTEKEEKPKKEKAKDDEPADHDKKSKDDRRMAQLMYMIFFGICCLVAIIIKFWGTDQLHRLSQFDSCNDVKSCLGNQVVLRISWASFFFFMLLCLCTVFVVQIHYNWFLPKFIVLAACVIGWFFLPNSFCDVWQEICRVLSFFFLVLQLIILIDFAMDIHEYLINPSGGAEGDDTMPCGAKVMYLVICLAGWGGGIAGCVCMFIYLGSCPLNKFFIAITLIMGVITTVLSVLNRFNKGLLVPSVIFAYATFVCWQAIASNPNTECNSRAEGNGSENLGGLIIGMIIVIVTLVYACSSAANAAPTLCTFGVPAKENDPDQKNYFFHFVMAMGCMYMAMILTNWGKTSSDPNSNTNTGISTESMWIKISSQWLAYLLYFWSLVAPVCMPDRDFSSGSNRFRDN